MHTKWNFREESNQRQRILKLQYSSVTVNNRADFAVTGLQKAELFRTCLFIMLTMFFHASYYLIFLYFLSQVSGYVNSFVQCTVILCNFCCGLNVVCMFTTSERKLNYW